LWIAKKSHDLKLLSDVGCDHYKAYGAEGEVFVPIYRRPKYSGIYSVPKKEEKTTSFTVYNGFPWKEEVHPDIIVSTITAEQILEQFPWFKGGIYVPNDYVREDVKDEEGNIIKRGEIKGIKSFFDYNLPDK